MFLIRKIILKLLDKKNCAEMISRLHVCIVELDRTLMTQLVPLVCRGEGGAQPSLHSGDKSVWTTSKA